ncbi:hypothetical protein [Paenibacillus sp. GCM10023250]|uniref:hypothetical protein n=1 Tax=Paenibacillus sp. GCM10023250 TaxID=3252648 RepID=UPI00361108F0
MEFNSYSNKRLPGSINTITQAVGIIIATSVGASLIKYAPFPLHLSYWVLCALVFFSIIFCLFLPQKKQIRTPRVVAGNREESKFLKDWRGLYIVAGLAIGTAFGAVAIFVSLGAQIARDIIGTKDILVIGAVLSISYLLMAVTAVFAGKLRPVISIRIGLVSNSFYIDAANIRS